MRKQRRIAIETEMNKIKNRMRAGHMVFGDKKKLKDLQAELNGEFLLSDW